MTPAQVVKFVEACLLSEEVWTVNMTGKKEVTKCEMVTVIEPGRPGLKLIFVDSAKEFALSIREI